MCFYPDPYEDQFEKKLKERKERIAKNEYQRLRNIARRTGKKAPDTAKTDVVTDKRKQSSKEVSGMKFLNFSCLPYD